MPGADAPGRPRLRELRHDFRAYYHCRYDDVDPDEAVDLIATLPQGSLYRASLDPHLAWSDERHDLADIKDLIVMSMHLSATGSTEGSRMVVRPGTLEDTERARMLARQARERIEQTEWRDVTDG